ncbi:MAG: tetratricopeptide repeat protein [Lachnospiraceae bacterium]|nr:tetratricopeptide repeat protein [Lachnospiraceae bacterium]
MSGYRLCRIPAAKNPYFIENISTNVYTIEELCYYMYHNTALLDATFVGSGLTRWIASELGMKNTAMAMEKAFLDNKSLAGFLTPVFEETGYLNPAEMKAYRQELDQLLHDPVWVRMKKKGDALVHYGKVIAAERIYRQALDMAELLDPAEQEEPQEVFEEKRRAFESRVWHNIGVAAMKMLDYDEAVNAFQKALDLLESEENKETLLLAYGIAKPKERYLEMLQKSGVSREEQEQLQKRLDGADALVTELPQDPDTYVDLLTVKYHNATDS